MRCCNFSLNLASRMVSFFLLIITWVTVPFCGDYVFGEIDISPLDGNRNTRSVVYNFVKEPIDVVIPAVNKDRDTVDLCIQGIRRNCSQIRRIIVVSAHKITDQAEWFDESKFPFQKIDVAFYLTNQNMEEATHFLKKSNSRCGWYYQQLLKFYAPFVIPGISSNVLILDSDTIFLNPVTFLDEKGFPLFNPATEMHWPYFTHQSRLLPGQERLVPWISGICHHMIFQKCVLKDLFRQVKKIHSRPFWQAFCLLVDPQHRDQSGASEYEIYFNFIFSQTLQSRCRVLKWENTSRIHDLESFRQNGFHYVSCHAYLRGK